MHTQRMDSQWWPGTGCSSFHHCQAAPTSSTPVRARLAACRCCGAYLLGWCRAGPLAHCCCCCHCCHLAADAVAGVCCSGGCWRWGWCRPAAPASGGAAAACRRPTQSRWRLSRAVPGSARLSVASWGARGAVVQGQPGLVGLQLPKDRAGWYACCTSHEILDLARYHF